MSSRLAAAIEAIAMFAAALLVFWLEQQEPLASWKSGLFGRRLVLEYLSLLALVLGYLLLRGQATAALGLDRARRGDTFLIVIRAFVPFFLVSVALNQISWRSWPGAIAIAALTLAMLALTARLLRRQDGGAGRTAATLLLPPLGLAISPAVRQLGWEEPLLNLAMAYLLVAPAEELLFRGLIQHRLNQAFGRPHSFGGAAWGWGLIASSLLFGLWHVLNPLSTGGWPQGLWTAGLGLMLGFVRERSGGVTAPALLHGVVNYGPQALVYDLVRVAGG